MFFEHGGHMKSAAIYLRVSTRVQTTENQRLELECVASAKGWTIDAVYEDFGVSGAGSTDRRPELSKLLADATRAKFQVLMAWDVSRLGRSLTGLVNTLDELHSNGIDLYIHQQAVDTTTPSGKAMYQLCGVFAEFERSMIKERVRAGLARAVAHGQKLGRPSLKIDAQELRNDRITGLSYRAISIKHGISLGKTYELIASSDQKHGV
jgi:DNA invertase Pin-like site-specific DNA recombinase